jgi:hypothetical protein
VEIVLVFDLAVERDDCRELRSRELRVRYGQCRSVHEQRPLLDLAQAAPQYPHRLLNRRGAQASV